MSSVIVEKIFQTCFVAEKKLGGYRKSYANIQG